VLTFQHSKLAKLLYPYYYQNKANKRRLKMPYKVAEVIWKKDKIEFILGEPQKKEQKLLLYTEEEHPSFINFTQLAKIAKRKNFSHIY